MSLMGTLHYQTVNFTRHGTQWSPTKSIDTWESNTKNHKSNSKRGSTKSKRGFLRTLLPSISVSVSKLETKSTFHGQIWPSCSRTTASGTCGSKLDVFTTLWNWSIARSMFITTTIRQRRKNSWRTWFSHQKVNMYGISLELKTPFLSFGICLWILFLRRPEP